MISLNGILKKSAIFLKAEAKAEMK